MKYASKSTSSVPGRHKERRDTIRSERREVEEAHARLAAIVESSEDAIISTNLNGIVLSWNSSAERIYGYSAKEMLGRSINRLIPADRPDEKRPMHERIKRGERIGLLETVRVKKGGGRVDVALSVAPIKNDRGKIIGISMIGRNITEHKRAEEERVQLLLRERTARAQAETANRAKDEILAQLDALLAATPVGLGLVDRELRYIRVNQALASINGPSPEAHRGRSAREIIPLMADTVEPILRHVLATERPILNLEIRGATPASAGRPRHYQASYYPVQIPDERIIGVGAAVTDITESKQAEAQLKESQEQLRALAARLQAVREEERSRLAREIHDELGQALTVLKMDVAGLGSQLAQAPDATARERLQQKMQSILNLINTTIQAVRRIATDLRPGVLDDLGLTAAMEWQAQDFQTRTGIPCEFVSDAGLENIKLDPKCAAAVFRIFQETLTNIIRHARATQVNVRWRAQAGSLILMVKDNGIGITKGEISSSQSLGLLGMRERALLFGGEIDIHGTPERGTSVTLRVPIKG